MYILTCPSCGSVNLEELQRDEFECADCGDYFSLSMANYEEE